jgi:hypothetical protein
MVQLQQMNVRSLGANMGMKRSGLAVILVMSCLAVTCGLPEEQGIKIGVPFRQQENFNYCAATSVQMWALYDGAPAVSQDTIFNWMRSYSSGCGSNLAGVKEAVGRFTNTFDAYIDLEYNSGTAYEDMAARQVTAIESSTPVIAVANNDHTVVLNGGKWHAESASNIWDFVYIHDPGFSSGNTKISAADWLELFCPGYVFSCSQVASWSSVAGWEFNLVTYGPWVEIRGLCNENGSNIQC